VDHILPLMTQPFDFKQQKYVPAFIYSVLLSLKATQAEI
jgi:hypothetical protein